MPPRAVGLEGLVEQAVKSARTALSPRQRCSEVLVDEPFEALQG